MWLLLMRHVARSMSSRTSSSFRTSSGLLRTHAGFASVELDDRYLVGLLRTHAGFASLEDSVLHLIIAYVPTRRYAPMPSPMSESAPSVPKALPPGPKAPPLHLR